MLDKNFSVTVRKLTDRDLMLEACESTFIGKSNQSLLSIYKSEHSPARTQLFWITIKNAPLFAVSHMVRHHIGIEKFQLTMRNDRHGAKDQCPYIADRLVEIIAIPEEYRAEEEVKEMYDLLDELKYRAGRNALTNLSILVNAQSLIDMSKVRLCLIASTETRQIFLAIKDVISREDPELASMMVRKCVYRGGICGEPKCCGFNNTPTFKEELREYLKNFTKTQQVGFSIEELYRSVCKAVRATQGFDRPGEMIARFITRQVIQKLPNQDDLPTILILECIIYVSSKHYFNEIADYFNQYLHNN